MKRMKKGLTVLFGIIVGIPVAIIGAYVLFAISLFVYGMCREGFKALDFPGVHVHATAKMHPLLISSKGIPTPIYVSVKDKYLKLDSETTRDETKKFFQDTGIDYKESFQDDITGGERFLIFAGCFELYYQHDKLVSYDIFLDRNENYFHYRGRNDVKIIDGVCIGTSRQALFPLPLRLADIEAMFGREYMISGFGRFI
ncbi:MAG: hypothetical protein IJS14_03575 [Lentisphaeria bacterium]|nr:hypothetical protein [Lentisphaeria bacterium]